MKNYFEQFIKINQKIFKTYNSKANILLVDRGRYLNNFFNIMGASILNKKKRIDVILLSDKKKNSSFIKFFMSFGISKFLVGFNFKFCARNFFVALNSLLLTVLSLIKLNKNGFFWFINNLKIEKIKIGDLVYDTYYRYDHKYINPKIDFDLSLILFKTIFRTLIISKYLDKHNIKFVLVGTINGAYNDSISMRLGIIKKAKVMEIQPNRVIMYSQKSIENDHLNVLSQDLKKNLRKKIQIKKIDKFLDKRIKNKVVTLYTGRKDILSSNKGRNFINKNKILKKINAKKNKIKKIILIAPHAFSDGCHSGQGFFIFSDYYQHLKQTLNFIYERDFSNILWIVRPHPTSDEYGELGIVEDLLKKFKRKNIILCPPNLKTSALVNICDHVITGRGTIGLEFACKGKYPITAGKSIYGEFGFSKISNNKKEYFKSISEIIKIPKLKEKQTNMAKKVLFYLENTKTLRNSQIFNDDLKIKRKESNIFKKIIKKLNLIKYQEDKFYNDLEKNFDYLLLRNKIMFS